MIEYIPNQNNIFGEFIISLKPRSLIKKLLVSKECLDITSDKKNPSTRIGIDKHIIPKVMRKK
jgi:hypothetical protein